MIRLLSVILLTLTFIPTAAQDAPPTCTPDQAKTIANTINASTLTADMSAATALMPASTTTDRDAIQAYLAFDALQTKWWTEIVPAFPDCAQAAEVTHNVGRFLDEVLLFLSVKSWAVSTDNADLSKSGSAHNAQLQVMRDAIVKSFDTLDTLSNDAAAAGEAAGVVVSTSNSGDSRTNPVPFGQSQIVSARKYDGTIQLIDFFDDANAVVFAKSKLNEPAPSGKHYVMIDFKLTCDRAPADSCEYSRIDLSLVGSKGVSYQYDSAPHLRGFVTDQEIFGGGEADLSVAFLVDDDDSSFILFTEYGDPRVFFATE